MHVVGNPYSISWAKEMLGYSFMGLATLIVAPIFKVDKIHTWIRWLIVFNGTAGVLGLIGIGIADPGWVLEPFGLILWIIWTVVTIVPFILLIMVFKGEENLY